ncbi:MAG: SiaB family protein kinase [Flavobacteriales bacterium]|nr:SiaB family protein kinase [Flavobacteriales bacterium]
MNLAKFNPVTQTLLPDNFSIWYQGKFDDAFTAVIIDLSEFNVINEEDMKKSRKKISFLLAESFQNVVRHGDREMEVEDEASMFGVRQRGKVLMIYSSNVVDEATKELLEKSLEKVNRLNRDELRAYYKDVFLNGEVSDKGGAGLGLIEMARKSDHSLQYEFRARDNGKFHFMLQINIGSKEAEREEIESMHIADSIAFHEVLKANKTLFLFKGDFNRATVRPLLNIIEGNQDKSREFENKRVFHVGVEFMQNICDHCVEKGGSQNGVFAMAIEGDKHFFYASNPVTSEQKEGIDKHLKNINGKNKGELDTLFKETLKASLGSDSNNAGIGWIDVARIVRVPMQYDFKELTDGSTWFSIGAVV